MIPLSMPSRMITVVDADATKLPYWSVTDAVWASMGATCATAGGMLTGRYVYVDASMNLVGCSAPITFTSGAGPADWGSAWLGTPNGPTSIEVSADKVAFKVDSVTGIWTLALQGFSPPTPLA